MTTTRFAILFGIIFLLAGIGGFVPGLSPVQMHHDVLVAGSSRLAFGLFPVNVVHNVVHGAFGIWGLVASRSLPSSIGYARGVAVIYAALTLFGLVPQMDTLFGLVPLYGNDVWLHALLAIIAGYFGFLHRNHHSLADTSSQVRS